MVLPLLMIAWASFKCYAQPSVARETHESSAVIVAKVISEHDSINDDGIEGYFFRLQVQEVVRGSVPLSVEVYTGNDTGRMILTVGARYLLFPRLWDGLLVINKCTNGENLTEQA